MIYVGTSGFSYNDWVGNFYPAGMPRREWLTYYACEFNTCEVNSTYYALPKSSSLKAMAEKTGDGFIFSFIVNQEMTHPSELVEWLPKIQKLDSSAEKLLSSPTITGVGRQSALFANCG